MVYHALQIRRGLLHHMWLSRDVLDSVIVLIAHALPAISILLQAVQTNNRLQLGVDSEQRVLPSRLIF